MSDLVRKLSKLRLNNSTPVSKQIVSLTRREHHIPATNNVRSESPDVTMGIIKGEVPITSITPTNTNTNKNTNTCTNSIFRDKELKSRSSPLPLPDLKKRHSWDSLYFNDYKTAASHGYSHRNNSSITDSIRSDVSQNSRDYLDYYSKTTVTDLTDRINYADTEASYYRTSDACGICNTIDGSSKVMLECGHFVKVDCFGKAILEDTFSNVCNVCGQVIEAEDKYCLLSKYLKKSKISIKDKRRDIDRIESDIKEMSLMLEEFYKDYESLKDDQTRIKSVRLSIVNDTE